MIWGVKHLTRIPQVERTTRDSRVGMACFRVVSGVGVYLADLRYPLFPGALYKPLFHRVKQCAPALCLEGVDISHGAYFR